MRWLAKISALLLLLGCSPMVGDPRTCAKTASLTTLPEDSVQAYSETTGVGGYLLATHTSDIFRWDDPTTHSVSHCTAYAQRNLRHEGEFAIWTAAHCIDYASVLKLEFVRYDPSETTDGFGTWKRDSDVLNLGRTLEALKAMSQQVPREIFQAVIEVIAAPAERKGAQWCTQLTSAHKSTQHQQLCTSLDDMDLFRFNTQATPLRDGALAQLRADIERLPVISDLDAEDRLKRWQLAYMVMGDSRARVIMARFMDRVRACPSSGGDVFCQNKEMAATISGMIFNKFVDFNPSLTETQALADFERAKNTVRTLWKNELLPAGQSGLQEGLRIHGGFHFVSALPETSPEFSPLDIPSKTAFLALPFLAGVAEGTGGHEVLVDEQGMLLNKPLSHAIRLWKGDSGTLVSFTPASGVAFPLGVLSTVDGEPTSGGLAMRPVNAGTGDEPEAPGVAPKAGTPAPAQANCTR